MKKSGHLTLLVCGFLAACSQNNSEANRSKSDTTMSPGQEVVQLKNTAPTQQDTKPQEAAQAREVTKRLENEKSLEVTLALEKTNALKRAKALASLPEQENGFAMGSYKISRAIEYNPSSSTTAYGFVPISTTDLQLKSKSVQILLEADATDSYSSQVSFGSVLKEGIGTVQLYSPLGLNGYEEIAPLRENPTYKNWRAIGSIPLQPGRIEHGDRKDEANKTDQEAPQFAVRHFALERTDSFPSSWYHGQGKLVSTGDKLRKGKYLVWLHVDEPHEEGSLIPRSPVYVVLEDGIGSISVGAYRNASEQKRKEVQFTGWQVIGYRELEPAIIIPNALPNAGSYDFNNGISIFEIRENSVKKSLPLDSGFYEAKALLVARSDKYKNGAHLVIMRAVLENGDRKLLPVTLRDGIGQIAYMGSVDERNPKGGLVGWVMDGIITMNPAIVVKQPILSKIQPTSQ